MGGGFGWAGLGGGAQKILSFQENFFVHGGCIVVAIFP